jgi:hypothetical protein
MAALAGIDWVQHAGTAWNFAKASATAGLAFVAALPRTCQLASAHAALVRGGVEPQYYATPGFGPLEVGWGWLLLGMATGAVAMLLCLQLAGWVHREPTIAMLAQVANAQPANVYANQHHADVLRYVTAGGRPALQELAGATGMTEAQFLQRILGLPSPQQPQAPQQQIPQHGPWDFPQMPQRIHGMNFHM